MIKDIHLKNDFNLVLTTGPLPYTPYTNTILGRSCNTTFSNSIIVLPVISACVPELIPKF